jgi:hypothetical protein
MAHEQLIEGLLPLSVSDRWSIARREWVLSHIEISEEPRTCVCGQYPINELCYLHNTHNNADALVGNVCVQNFMGIESRPLFAAAKRLAKDLRKPMGERLYLFAVESRWLSAFEVGFYSNTRKRKRLTAKQMDVRIAINEKVLSLIRHPPS